MSVNPLSRAKVPEGTILFADRLAADGLSLCSSFSELVPKKFAMVCDLECDNVRGLIEKFMSVFDFEHIAILISGPISRYLKVIKAILGFGEFDIVMIMSMWPNDDISVLPKQLHKVFQSVDPFICAVRAKFWLVPTMPRLVPGIVFSDESFNPRLMARVVEQVVKCQGEQVGKLYAFGDYSRNILDALEDSKSGEGAAGVLLVDRISCATPLFVHNASLLDSAASINVTSVLKDPSMIDAELKGNTRKEIATTLRLPAGSTIEAMRQQWSGFSQEKKNNALAKRPSLDLLLDRRYADLCQLETNILEGADLEEMLESFPLDLGKYLRLVGFAHMIEPVDAKHFVAAAAEQCGGGMSEVRNEQQQIAVLNRCSSGVKLGLGKSHRMRELFLLPKLLQSVLDKNAEMDGRIQGTQGLLSTFGLFSKKGGLKECKKIFVFVFGGISFFEMKEISELSAKFPDVDLRIFSDTICSAIDMFAPSS